MKKIKKLLAILALGAAVSLPAQAVPVYQSANYSGGLFSVTSNFSASLAAAGISGFSSTSCFNCAAPAAVNGHVIYDTSVLLPSPIPSAGVNVASIGAIANVSNNAIFEFNIGSLSFHFGDAGIQGGPMVQYDRLGRFRGFFFDETFLSPNNTALEISLQGTTFTLRDGQFNTLLSGFLNGGNAGLTNRQLFVPPQVPDPGNNIPEPATLTLLGLALLGLVASKMRMKA